MRGWHRHSYEHALAARGIKSKKEFNPSKHNIRIVTEPYPGLTSMEDKGGWFNLYMDGKEIGRMCVSLHRRDTIYPFGYTVPAMTALTDSIELYKTKYEGMGLGTKLMEAAQKFARKNGMKRIWATHVINKEWFKKKGYRYTGIGSIYEKVL